MTQNLAIKTPQTDPDHDVIGRLWSSWSGIYYCDSYDPRIGFWMTNIMNPTDRRNVSERAPHRTFHAVRGTWNPQALDPELSYFMVDMRAEPFEAVPVSLDQARQALPGQALFHEDYAATAAIRHARQALVGQRDHA